MDFTRFFFWTQCAMLDGTNILYINNYSNLYTLKIGLLERYIQTF